MNPVHVAVGAVFDAAFAAQFARALTSVNGDFRDATYSPPLGASS
jgi:hypothetical protein